MTERAAIVTGASTGIGFAIAEMLAENGHALTINSRRAERVEAAAEQLRAAGHDVQAVGGNVADEAVIAEIVRSHRERFGRLDVLVNNAGMGIGQTPQEVTAKAIDIQLGANLRHIPLFYREAIEMLQAAGAEHGNALVVNTASISGKRPEPWIGVYSAAKAGVIAFTEAMNRSFAKQGVKSCALCPGYVDTEMSAFAVTANRQQMIQVGDIAAMVRTLLSLSPGCVIPEIIFDSLADIASTLEARD